MANQVVVTNSGNVQVSIEPPPNVQVQISRAAIGNITVSNVTTANYANYAGNVINPNQPNITSLGTITGLTSSGNITAPFFIGNVVGNISGNLVVPGSNTAVLYNNQGNAGASDAFKFDQASNTVTILGNLVGGNISGNGAGIANITGANVIGEVAYANVANNVAGGNVSGAVAYATVANSVAVGNVSGIGNIATVNLDGNASNVLLGNGTFGPVSVSNVANANYASFANVANTANSVAGANVTGTVANANYSVYSGNANYANFAGTAYSVSGANVSGTVANANYAAYAGNANIANTANSVAGSNVTGTVANANYASFSNVANSANSVAGANVTGTVANANYAAYAGNITVNAQPNITSLGTLTTLGVSGNISAGNINGGNLVSANYLSGDGYLISNLTVGAGSQIVNGNSNVVVAANGNVTTSVGGTANVFVVTSAGANLTGNLTTSNANLGNLATANYFSGDGGLLSNIIAANITGVVATRVEVKNTSGGTLTKGTPVYVTGTVGASPVVEVSASRADTAGTMGCIGLLETTLTNGSTGYAVAVGPLRNLNTSGFVTGDELYVGATGGITNVRPTNNNIVQSIGVAGRIDNTTGSIEVNIWNIYSLPNLNDGNIWVGNSSNGYPAQIVLSTANVGNANFASYANIANTANTVAGANVTGTVANANYAAFAGTAYSVSGSNVSGTVANANYSVYAGTAYSVSGSNVSGQVANANYASYANVSNVANSVSVGNVSGIGNIATVNLDGNASNILYGNGVFAGITTVANANYANFANVANTANSVAVGNVTGIGNIATVNLSGNASQVLLGNGTFGQTSIIANGTSNVSIPSANDSVRFSVAGNANIVVIDTNSVLYANAIAGGYNNQIRLQTYGNLANGNGAGTNRIAQFRARGNSTSQLSVQPSDRLMELITFGHNGTAFQTNSFGTLRAVVDSSYTANAANIPIGWVLTVTDTTGGNNNPKSHNFYANGTTQLVGPLTTNSNISGTYLISNTGSNLTLSQFQETVSTANVSGTITPNVAASTIFNYTLTGNITLNALGNVLAGSSATLVLKQDSTGNRTLSSTMKFSGGYKTLSTAANATDILCVFFDGSTYYASLTTGYA